MNDDDYLPMVEPLTDREMEVLPLIGAPESILKTWVRACNLPTRSKLIATRMMFVRSSTKKHLRKCGLKGGRCY